MGVHTFKGGVKNRGGEGGDFLPLQGWNKKEGWGQGESILTWFLFLLD